jgi:hypothetical protein
MLAQCVDRDGRTDLFLLRCQRVVFDGLDSRGGQGCDGCALTFERMPYSKHVTRRSGHAHRVLGSLKPDDVARGACLCVCVCVRVDGW